MKKKSFIMRIAVQRAIPTNVAIPSSERMYRVRRRGRSIGGGV